MNKLLKGIIVFVTILIVVVGVFVYSNERPMDKNDTKYQFFKVSQGEGSKQIIHNLHEKGFIRSEDYAYVRMRLMGQTFYANDYALDKGMSLGEITKIISTNESNITPDIGAKFTIVEGDNIQNIAYNIAKDSDVSSKELLDLWSNKEYLNKLIDKYWFLTDEILDKDIRYPLEGYFTPATFIIPKDKSAEEITTMLLDNSATVFEKYKDVKYPNNFTFHEVLTLAAIVERETNLDEDKPMVAGVFYNRLKEDMPLQSDITVLYGQGKHKEQVLYSDLKHDSPYNTYLHKGLTPGPIASPSVKSIDAVLNPKKHDYLYYFSRQDTGKAIFSKTFEEHKKVSKDNAWEF